MTSKTSHRVKFVETDLLRIVHHSKYPLWFEKSRSDYLKNADIPVGSLNAMGIFLPLLEMRCEFKSPARYRDRILLNTRLTYLSCVKAKFEYEVFNGGSGKRLAAGHTVHVWTDKKLIPLNMEKAAPEIYCRLRKLTEETDR